MSAKVLTFEQSPEWILNLAEECIEEGDYLRAIKLTKQALAMQPRNNEIRLQLGSLLSEQHLIGLANQQFLYVLADEPENQEALGGLGRNFMLINDYVKSSYYIKRLEESIVENNDDDTDDDGTDDFDIKFICDNINFLSNAHTSNGYRLVHPLNTETANNIKNSAKNALREGNTELFFRLLKDVEENYPNDIECINLLAFGKMYNNEIDEAIALANKALALDENNITANCNLAILYNTTNNQTQLKKVLERFEKVTATKVEDIYKIATTMCDICNDKQANKWLNHFFSLVNVNDMEMNVLYAISCYNIKKYRVAHETLIALNDIDDENSMVIYLLSVVGAYREEGFKHRRIEYSLTLPQEEVKKRYWYLHEKVDIVNIWKDRHLFDVVNWVLLSPDEIDFAKIVLERLRDLNQKETWKYFRRLLVNVNIDKQLKICIVQHLLSKSFGGKINIVNNELFITVDVSKKYPHLLKEALIEAISILAFEYVAEKKFVKFLINSANILQDQLLELSDDEIIEDTKLIAALIVRRSQLKEFDDKQIIQLFGIEYSTLSKLDMMLND